MKLTYEIIHAIAMDEANRNMKKHGRKRWNVDDWNVAAAVFDKLDPLPVDTKGKDNDE